MFKYSNKTSSYTLYNETYNTICSIYQSASIPITKSKQRIIEQIKELESRRKQINKKTQKNISDFITHLHDIFPVVKLHSDVPLVERTFYIDQCSNRELMISSSIDK